MSTKTLNLLRLVRKFSTSLIGRRPSKYYHDVEAMPTKYGGKSNVTILPGVGIGPELMHSTMHVLDAAEAPLTYEVIEITPGDEMSEEFDNALTSIKRNKVALKGNIEVKSKDPLVTSRNVALRRALDLYVYVLPLKTLPGLETRFGTVDVVIIRQNTEGEYLMLEHEPVPGKVEKIKVITKYNSMRIAEYAFHYAKQHHRKRITVVHSADVQPLTEGLFVDAALAVSKAHPDVRVKIQEVGAAVVHLIQNPSDYDLILATNLNGSMVGNFLNGMIGGPALSSGSNLGSGGIAVFEPGARNKGSSIVGKGIANPVAMFMAAVDLLNYLGYDQTATIISEATHKTLLEDHVFTQDMGGTATTAEFTTNVIRHIKAELKFDERHRPLPKTFEHAKIQCPPPEVGSQ